MLQQVGSLQDLMVSAPLSEAAVSELRRCKPAWQCTVMQAGAGRTWLPCKPKAYFAVRVMHCHAQPASCWATGLLASLAQSSTYRCLLTARMRAPDQMPPRAGAFVRREARHAALGLTGSHMPACDQQAHAQASP